MADAEIVELLLQDPKIKRTQTVGIVPSDDRTQGFIGPSGTIYVSLDGHEDTAREIGLTVYDLLSAGFVRFEPGFGGRSEMNIHYHNFGNLSSAQRSIISEMLAPYDEARFTTYDSGSDEIQRALFTQAGKNVVLSQDQPLENPSSPESIARSLEKADRDHTAWLKAYRDKTKALPEGTNIGGWVKETVAGDVFWRKGRRYVVDVVVEAGSKKTDEVLAKFQAA